MRNPQFCHSRLSADRLTADRTASPHCEGHWLIGYSGLLEHSAMDRVSGPWSSLLEMSKTGSIRTAVNQSAASVFTVTH